MGDAKAEIAEPRKPDFAAECSFIHLILMAPFILHRKAFLFGFLIMTGCDMQAEKVPKRKGLKESPCGWLEKKLPTMLHSQLFWMFPEKALLAATD